MADECIEFRKLEDRCRELKEWINHKAPQCATEQKHLEDGSQERGYWAHGYMSALADVIRLFSRQVSNPQFDEGENSTSRYAA